MEPGSRTRELGSAAEREYERPPPRAHATPLAVWAIAAARVWRRLRGEPLWLLAGGVALFGLLSLMPAIAATVAIYGLVADPADIEAQVEPLARVVPPEVVALVEAQLSDAALSPPPALGLAFAASVALALFGASGGIRALMTALNIAHRCPEGRRLLRRLGLALLLGLGGIATVIVTVGLVVLLPTALRLIALEGRTATVISFLRWPVLCLLVVAALAVLYRVGPVVSPRRILPGTLLATFLWTLGSVLLSLYVDRVANYSGLYGAFGGVMIVMLWFYVSSLVVLVGALLNQELEEARSRRGSGGAPRRPRPERCTRGA